MERSCKKHRGSFDSNRVIAVDELLLAEADELPCGNIVCSLHRSRRAECPARSTDALQSLTIEKPCNDRTNSSRIVNYLHLDVRDGALVSPIKARGETTDLHGGRGGELRATPRPAGLILGRQPREGRLKLLLGEVGEGGDPVHRGGVQRLVLRGSSEVPREHPQPARVLLAGAVLLPKRPQERPEPPLGAPQPPTLSHLDYLRIVGTVQCAVGEGQEEEQHR